MGLDLSRIEAWTRAMLEAEARRRGIRGPEFRTRSELIRVILRHQYGDRLNAGRERFAKGVRAVEEARDLLSSAVTGALSALPAPIDGLLGLRRKTQPRPASRARPRAAQPGTGDATTRNQVPGRSGGTETKTRDSDPVRQRGKTERAGRRLPVVPSRPQLTAIDEEARFDADASERPSELADGDAPQQSLGSAPQLAAASAPQLAGASTRTFVEEPIRTHSMARLLAAQGHRERALAIYEELLARDGEDAVLRREAERVRLGQAIDPPHLPQPRSGHERASLPDSADALHCERDAQGGLRLRWSLSDDGLRRARAVLGSEGELAVRVVTIRPDREQVVRSEITEHGPVSAAGTWQSPALAGTARCFAAAGVRCGDRFVAVVHAEPDAASVATSGHGSQAAAH